MRHVAKIFRNGRSQAVRLPAAFRFDCKEVYIRRDHETGDVIISRKPAGNWKDFFKLLDTLEIPDDFMSERQDAPPQDRNFW